MGKITSNSFIFLVIIALLMVGCTPFTEPIPSASTVPVFYMTGSMNGNSFAYVSDGENYRSESSQFKDSLNVSVFSGRIVSMNCTSIPCFPSVEFSLRGNSNIHESVVAEPFAIRYMKDYTPTETSLYTITLSPEALGNPTVCTWVIDGEVYETQGLNTLSIERSSEDSSAVWVSLTAQFAGGCSSSIENYVYLPHHGCSAQIKSRSLSAPQHKLFEAKTTGKPAFDYQWSFESGVTAHSVEVEYFFNSTPSDGVETILLQVDGDNCRATWSRNEVINDSTADCNINFNCSIETEITVSEPPVIEADMHSIELVYVNDYGQKFWSISAEQPAWAYFNIEDVQDYTEPLTGSLPHAKKVEAAFSMMMKAKNGDIIELKDCRLVLPVGLF